MDIVDTLSIPISAPHRESNLHLYLAWACPFCHRVLAALVLTGLTEQIGITWMRNIKSAAGWEIAAGDDPLFGETMLQGIYEKLDSYGKHKPSVPLLVDRSSKKLLSTSSAQITRFFSTGMNGNFPVKLQLAPLPIRDNINYMNQYLHENINRAVYRVGFATKQSEYESRVHTLFDAIDTLEQRLGQQAFLFGDFLTESDLYLLATLVRFDSVYYPLFRCNYRHIADYPTLSEYLRLVCSLEGIADTYNASLNIQHYYCSTIHMDGEIRFLNPSGNIPVDSQNNLKEVNT